MQNSNTSTGPISLEEKIFIRRQARQLHDYKKTRKKHLPMNPVQKITGTLNIEKRCKQCNIHPRAQSSARCVDCTSFFKRNNGKEFIPPPKPI